MKKIILTTLFFINIAYSITPTLVSMNASCDNKYCATIRGLDFDADASVLVREDVTGSISTTFAGNDIFGRWSTGSEDTVFFPIQNLSLQNQWNNNGLCFKINNNGQHSNEHCFVRTQNPIQPPFMGQTIEGYPGQDIENTSWVVKGDASPLTGGNILKIWGNSWKQIDFNYTITRFTVLKFDFKSNEQEAEINGVGFRFQDGTVKLFQVFGTQNTNPFAWIVQDYNNYSGISFKSYEIPIGEYFQESENKQIIKMFFVGDEDNHVGQRSVYKNPIVEEQLRIIYADSAFRIADRYVITYKENIITNNNLATQQQSKLLVQDITQSLANKSNSQIIHEYYTPAYGSALFNTNQQMIEGLYSNPNVDIIYADTSGELTTNQYDAQWHLDRVDQNNFPLDSIYNYSNQGTGVEVFVLDSGVSSGHSEFSGRVQTTMDFTNEVGTSYENIDAINNGLGHGTAVADVVGGSKNGIAKDVTLHSLKVATRNDVIKNADVRAALDYIHLNYSLPSVVNMSFHATHSNYVENSIISLIEDKNIVVVTSAANQGGNACSKFPGNVEKVITVAATSYMSNRRWVDSNHGTCVDIYAPGDSVNLATPFATNSYANFSGTSFAAPAVAGAVALYLESNPTATYLEVKTALLDSASTGLVLKPNSSTPVPAGENYFLDVSTLMPFSEIFYPDVYENDDDPNVLHPYSGGLEHRDFLDDTRDIVDFVIPNGQQCHVEFTNLGSNADICVRKIRHTSTGDIIIGSQICGINNSSPIDNRVDLVDPGLRFYVKNTVSGSNTEYTLGMVCEGAPDAYEDDDTFQQREYINMDDNFNTHNFNGQDSSDWVSINNSFELIDGGCPNLTCNVEFDNLSNNDTCFQTYESNLGLFGQPLVISSAGNKICNISNGIYNISNPLNLQTGPNPPGGTPNCAYYFTNNHIEVTNDSGSTTNNDYKIKINCSPIN